MLKYLLKKFKERKQKKEKEEVDNLLDIKRAEFYGYLKSLYGFVVWLNNSFPSRKARKQFWKDVSDGNPHLEEAIKGLADKYSKGEIDTKCSNCERDLVNKEHETKNGCISCDAEYHRSKNGK